MFKQIETGNITFTRFQYVESEYDNLYIKYILQGIPLLSFYAEEDRDGRLKIMIGNKRITTILDFYRSEKFKDLADRNQALFEDYIITIHYERVFDWARLKAMFHNLESRHIMDLPE